jgi:hypothetical protein
MLRAFGTSLARAANEFAGTSVPICLAANKRWR